MEVLVVIALLGTVTAFVALDLLSLFEGAKQPSPFETLRAAMAAGRDVARDSGAPVKITFSPETSVVRLTGVDGVKDFPLPAGSSLGFYLPADVSDAGERPLDAVVFHPSGCATPVTLDLGISGSRSRYRLEMFSAALTEEEKQ
jgi:hypothetical protein